MLQLLNVVFQDKRLLILKIGVYGLNRLHGETYRLDCAAVELETTTGRRNLLRVHHAVGFAAIDLLAVLRLKLMLTVRTSADVNDAFGALHEYQIAVLGDDPHLDH